MKKILSGALACCAILCLPEFVFPEKPSRVFFKNKDISRFLREIYLQIKDFEKYPGCDFIKREFFVGDDDDDTNKDVHVVIILQDDDEKEKVTIQVTYMERTKGKPVIGIAKHTKILSFFIQKDRIEIIKSDFDTQEKEIVLPGILQAIKNKKKLLKEIELG